MKRKLIVLVVSFFVITAGCWMWPDQELSEAERRALKQKPELDMENVMNGSFMSDFESYTLDQFPLRDQLRSLKALAEYGCFQKKDNNDLYVKDGYVAQILYPLSENSVNNAAKKFGEIYEKFLTGSDGRIFVSAVPDKGYYMAQANGYPALDYQKMFGMLADGMDYAKFIDISGALQLEDYYKTDSHWRQEKLLPVMEVLLTAMNEGTAYAGSTARNLSILDEAELVTATEDFRGVYYGQSALPLPAETINYLTWDEIEDCEGFNFEINQEVDVYQLDKLTARDPYDIFLGGAAALITVENLAAARRAEAAGEEPRELILFRDSFGSSIAPLFLADYSKVTLVDIRYMASSFLDQFIDFHGQDVLFLYGTTMLNDSFTFK